MIIFLFIWSAVLSVICYWLGLRRGRLNTTDFWDEMDAKRERINADSR